MNDYWELVDEVYRKGWESKDRADYDPRGTAEWQAAVDAFDDMKQRLDKAESKLNSFEYAVEHVTETGKTLRSVSSSDGWAIVHKERLTDLEIAEERLAEAEAKLTETEKELFLLASDVFFCERCVNAGLLDKAKRIYDGLSGSEGE